MCVDKDTWISVKDQLPKRKKWYIYFQVQITKDDDTFVVIGYMDCMDRWYVLGSPGDGFTLSDFVTYYQPLAKIK